MIWVEPEPKNTALGRIRPKLQMTLGLNVLLPMVFFPFPDWGPRLFCCNSCLIQDLLDMPWKAVPSYILFLQTEMTGQEGECLRAIEAAYRQGFAANCLNQYWRMDCCTYLSRNQSLLFSEAWPACHSHAWPLLWLSLHMPREKMVLGQKWNAVRNS